METEWGIIGKSGRFEVGEGGPRTAFLHSSAQGRSLVLCVDSETTFPASNLDDFLLCDFRIKYYN